MDNIIINAMKAIILYNRKALIVKRTETNKIAGGIWEFVGGKLEFGEDLISGLKREIQEETGLTVTVEKLLFATSFKTHDYRQVVIINYLCSCDTDQVTLSEEHTEYLWADKAELLSHLGKRTLKDLEENHILEQLELE
ncbi:NUDIX domain-containing protein [Anaerocolumna sp. AGMB13025]|uniref:NUDIX hydrolase n=1 Tax=Anaerocolumna sp. AGMB13025 TaxID=3039116 RepID=UPI00241D661B|nr:NUDIX domain-containing protein [Anaerocolumna sp. AGMB13025]WFR58456.1 NUDIX domain-containing protein [Anaerocolumna sp. AGMB13025]